MTAKALLKWLGFCLISVIASSGLMPLAAQTGVTYAWNGNYSFGEGSKAGAYWTCLWLGFGTGNVRGGELLLKPMTPTKPGESHSALVRSDFDLGQAWDISLRVSTDRQLRTSKIRKRPSDPNPWEVAWLIAKMADDGSAGLCFIFKPNGVELSAYRLYGEERIYLFTANGPVMLTGQSYLYRLACEGNTVVAFIGDTPVAQASLGPLSGWSQLGGKIGLYTEDAAVRFGPITVTSWP